MKKFIKKGIALFIVVAVIMSSLPLLSFAASYRVLEDNGKMLFAKTADSKYDIKGYVNGELTKATDENGFTTNLKIDDGEPEEMLFNDNNSTVSNESMAVTTSLSFTADGNAVLVRYDVENISGKEKTYSLGVSGNVQVGDNVYAPVENTDKGLKISNADGKILYVNVRDYGLATNPSGLWYGPEGNRLQNLFPTGNTTEKITKTDVGMSLAWNDVKSISHQVDTYYFVVQVSNEISNPTEFKINEPSSELTYQIKDVEDGKGIIDVDASVKDLPEVTDYLYYSFDDGKEAVLAEKVGTGSEEHIVGQVPMLTDTAKGTHKIKFWVGNENGGLTPIAEETVKVLDHPFIDMPMDTAYFYEGDDVPDWMHYIKDYQGEISNDADTVLQDAVKDGKFARVGEYLITYTVPTDGSENDDLNDNTAQLTVKVRHRYVQFGETKLSTTEGEGAQRKDLTATVSAEVIYDTGEDEITESGITWKRELSPSVEDTDSTTIFSATPVKQGETISETIQKGELERGVVYYARPFVKANDQYYYGDYAKIYFTPDDSAGLVSVNYASFDSNTNKAIFNVNLTNAIPFETQRVYLRTVNGTAVAGTHYYARGDDKTKDYVDLKADENGNATGQFSITERGADQSWKDSSGKGYGATAYTLNDTGYRNYYLEAYKVEHIVGEKSNPTALSYGIATIDKNNNLTERKMTSIKGVNDRLNDVISHGGVGVQMECPTGSGKDIDDKASFYNGSSPLSGYVSECSNGGATLSADHLKIYNNGGGSAIAKPAMNDSWVSVIGGTKTYSFSNLVIPDKIEEWTGFDAYGIVLSETVPLDKELIFNAGFTGNNIIANTTGTFNLENIRMKCIPQSISVVGANISSSGTGFVNGNEIYVSLILNQVVRTNNAPTVTIPGLCSGNLSYVSGDGTNVLLYKGIVSSDACGSTSYKINIGSSNASEIFASTRDRGFNATTVTSNNVLVDTTKPQITITDKTSGNTSTHRATIEASHVTHASYVWSESKDAPTEGWTELEHNSKGEVNQTVESAQTTKTMYLHVNGLYNSNGETAYVCQPFSFRENSITAEQVDADKPTNKAIINYTVSSKKLYTDIVLPDGTTQVIGSSGGTFSAESNGEYVFRVREQKGSPILDSVTVEVKNVCTAVPTITLLDPSTTEENYVKAVSPVYKVEKGFNSAEVSKVYYYWSKTHETPKSIKWVEINVGDSIPTYEREGDWYLFVKCADEAGNVSDVVKSEKITIVTKGPSVEFYNCPEGEVTGETNVSYMVTPANHATSHSKIARIYSSVGTVDEDFDGIELYRGYFTVPGPGTYFVTAEDELGNRTTDTVTLKGDINAPTVSTQLYADSVADENIIDTGEWTNHSVVARFTFTDDLNPIDSARYKFVDTPEDAEWFNFDLVKDDENRSATADLNIDRNTEIYVFVKDIYGVENAVQYTVNISQICKAIPLAPTVDIKNHTITATDNVAGIDKIIYSVDYKDGTKGVQDCEYNSDIGIIMDKAGTVTAYAVDKAGNASPTTTQSEENVPKRSRPAPADFTVNNDGGIYHKELYNLEFREKDKGDYVKVPDGKVLLSVGDTVGSVTITDGVVYQFRYPEDEMYYYSEKTEVQSVVRSRFNVAVNTCENGYINAEKISAYAGEEIATSAVADSGYILDSFTVNGVEIKGLSFIMPANNVVLDAKFREMTDEEKAFTYSMEVDQSSIVFDTKKDTESKNVQTETVVLTNTGKGTLSNISVMLNSEYFEATQPENTTLAAGASTTFKVKTISDLPIGKYESLISVVANGVQSSDVRCSVALNYEVISGKYIVQQFKPLGDITLGQAGSVSYKTADEVSQYLLSKYDSVVAVSDSNSVNWSIKQWNVVGQYDYTKPGSYLFAATLGEAPDGWSNAKNYEVFVNVILTN